MRAKGQLNERQADLLARIVSDEASVSSEDSTLALTVYALRRRGRDSPRKLRIRDTDGDLSANWFRNHIWLAAVESADIGMRVRIHDLRHAHASWLLPAAPLCRW